MSNRTTCRAAHRALPLALALAATVSTTPVATPLARAAPPPPGVARVRSVVAEVDGLLGKRSLRAAQLTIGGGQNPAKIVAHYAGGGDRDYERDPYAAPFHLRRLKREISLPAVGEASATIYYDAKGQPVFVLSTGADTMGVTQYPLHPTSQLRAYFQGRELVRLIYSGARDPKDEPDQTVDVASEADAKRRAKAVATGAALLRRAEALRDALSVLARSPEP
jgi:hypothetical protein